MSSKNSSSGGKRWLARFLLRSPIALRSIRRVPVLGWLAHIASRRILPAAEKVWVQVEAGPAKGIWLELNPRTGQGYFRGEVELPSQQVLAQWLRPGMVFYDLGANLGLFSLLAARLVGPSGRVFSFEPDPEVAARLKSNIARNGFENVVVVEAGVWSSSGTLGFSPADEASPDRGTGHVDQEHNGSGFSVRSVALDDFVKDTPPPDAIKCDVEGAELEALKGAQAVLRARHPWILCEMHSEANTRSGRDFLEKIGYRVRSLDANHILVLPANKNEAAEDPAVPAREYSNPESPEQWIALLGRRDEPTDGVEDYCTFLGRALAGRGVALEQIRVEWDKRGWLGAFRQLRRDSANWRNRRVILQYTALAWSRRGFPLGALAALTILRRCGICCAVMFHEPFRQGSGTRWIDRLRGAFQDRVIEKLYREATMSIFSFPLETITWLPKTHEKAVFIPIGANIPSRDHRRSPSPADAVKTVIVFGVTPMPQMGREVEEISGVMQEVSKTLARLRLVVIGRGSTEAREMLASALGKNNVDLVVQGIMPAEEVAREFENADVLLFVRGAITPQRGSAMAGIACGLPIVGYHKGDIIDPLREAGVEWSPWADRQSLARGIIKVLTDPARWTELHERNLELQKSTLSWDRIAELYCRALSVGEFGTTITIEKSSGMPSIDAQ